jgi:hypothetical protein
LEKKEKINTSAHILTLALPCMNAMVMYIQLPVNKSPDDDKEKSLGLDDKVRKLTLRLGKHYKTHRDQKDAINIKIIIRKI